MVFKGLVFSGKIKQIALPKCKRKLTILSGSIAASMKNLIRSLALILCFIVSASAQSGREQAENLKAYNESIYDASVYKFSNLRPLKPLVFSDTANSATVVTLTNYNGYKVGTENILTRDVWVTAVPEVKNLCQTFSGDVEMRLRQLLGLHPNQKFDKFVTMEVKRGDVFRPTVDPDPTITLPCACPVTVKCGEEFPANVDIKHVRWMAEQMLSSYVISESSLIPTGYPWTRLGYTYDWKPGSNKYGASEYVIRKEAKVLVSEINTVAAYCKAL